MLYDSQRAVDLLTSLPYVDTKRIGAIGHSLGAKEVLYLMAFDERVQVGVFSEGGVGIPMSNWDAKWYLGPEIHKFSGQHDHHELLALIAPRKLLILGGDSADGNQTWEYTFLAKQVHCMYTPKPFFGFFNHGKGHSVPDVANERIHQWFQNLLIEPR